MDEELHVLTRNPSDAAVARRILSAIRDRNTVFVFPTQTAADSWAEAILRFSPVEAIESDRFLSWDFFMRQACQAGLPAGRKPADAALRFLWASQIMAEQANTPFLEALAKPGFKASNSQLAFLARVAPLLRDFSFKVTQGHKSGQIRSLSPETLDFLMLSGRYDKFLDDHGCYEPGHCRPLFNAGNRYILFWPELAFDYDRYAVLLQECDAIEIDRPPDQTPGGDTEQPPAPKVFEFDTFREEFDWAFSSCRQLIEKRISPRDIAMSVPVLSPRAKAYLEESAVRHAVPIEFRIGARLSSSPFGQLLNALSRAADEGFSLGSLRSLFGIGAFSWKNRQAAAALVRFGEKYSIPDSSADRAYMVRLWARTFSICGSSETQDIRFFHDELKRAAEALGSAKSFISLRAALFDFRGKFLDESALSASTSSTLERILEELDKLAEWDSLLGQKTTSPFATFLALLDLVQYNPPASSFGVVSIYSYQTAVLLSSPIHFVLECSQDALGSFKGWLSDFPEEIQDLSPDIAKADSLVLDSFNVVNAVFCHASQGLSGYSVPNPYFAMKHFSPIAIDSRDDATESCAEVLEEEAWFKGIADELPGVLPQYQKDAALGRFAAI
ncbi:MAG: hypothetical protein LLF89_04275, partial [Spirochaetaceae bacterium]|nr:hypothetical protein [Spirochaetaceae bacterium]